MSEKGKFTAMTAAFLTLSVFCWSVALWSSNYQTASERTWIMPVSSPSKSTDESIQLSLEDSPSELSDSFPAASLSEEEQNFLIAALAGAGTPFFESSDTLSRSDLEDTAIWYRMEKGDMPSASGENVILPAENIRSDIQFLFGISLSELSDCSTAVYRAEDDVFLLPVAALTPCFYHQIEQTDTMDSSLFIRVSLYPPSGWEGDISGSRYLPDKSAEGILVLQNGHLLSWKNG